MSEKKNIVIKVKYPTPGKTVKKHGTTPGTITEWNFKRIALVLGGLLIPLLLWLSLGGDDKQEQSAVKEPVAMAEQPATTSPSASTTTEKTAAAPTLTKAPVATSKAVARSQLTSDINKNEPVDNLKLPLKIGKQDNLWIYYFVELKSMNGQAVYHEWWLNGNLVSRKKVNISDDPWRTASKQLITYTKNNDWVVRVVDESRNALAEKSFNLEIK